MCFVRGFTQYLRYINLGSFGISIAVVMGHLQFLILLPGWDTSDYYRLFMVFIVPSQHN
jgi:hypothetical protein